MSSPPSLRRELARILTVTSVGWLSAVFLVVALSVHHEVNDLMDHTLQEAAEVLYGVLVLHREDMPSGPHRALPAPPHEENLVWQIVNEQQQVVLRSHRAPDLPLLPGFKPGFSDGTALSRVYGMALPNQGEYLLVSQPGADRIESRYEAIGLVGLSALAVGLGCALWLRRRVRQALRPLQELTRQVQAYDPTRPATDLPPPARQEFVEVREAIMDLGQRLARRLASEQAFAAHAAHALRTPLAGMEAQLAIAQKEAAEAARPRLARTREAVNRLKRVVSSLLLLFRSEGELMTQEVQLDQLVAHLAPEGLSIEVEQRAALRADPNLLAAALANLLENSRRYGAAHCRLRCEQEGQAQVLTLLDDGPGVDAARCAELRASLQQTALSGDQGPIGLGLRLAALVARAHRGDLLILEAGLSGRGFGVSLRMPAPPNTARTGQR